MRAYRQIVAKALRKRPDENATSIVQDDGTITTLEPPPAPEKIRLKSTEPDSYDPTKLSPFQCLPYELLDPIFQQIPHWHLPAVARACKAFSGPATRLIWQHVQINFENLEDPQMPSGSRIPKEIQHIQRTKAAKAVEALLETQAGSFVRSIHLTGDRFNSKWTPWPPVLSFQSHADASMYHYGEMIAKIHNALDPAAVTSLGVRFVNIPEIHMFRSLKELVVHMSDAMLSTPMTQAGEFPELQPLPALEVLKIMWRPRVYGKQGLWYPTMMRMIGQYMAAAGRLREFSFESDLTEKGVSCNSNGYREQIHDFRYKLKCPHLKVFRLKSDRGFTQSGIWGEEDTPPIVTSMRMTIHDIFEDFLNRHKDQLEVFEWGDIVYRCSTKADVSPIFRIIFPNLKSMDLNLAKEANGGGVFTPLSVRYLRSWLRYLSEDGLVNSKLEELKLRGWVINQRVNNEHVWLEDSLRPFMDSLKSLKLCVELQGYPSIRCFGDFRAFPVQPKDVWGDYWNPIGIVSMLPRTLTHVSLNIESFDAPLFPQDVENLAPYFVQYFEDLPELVSLKVKFISREYFNSGRIEQKLVFRMLNNDLLGPTAKKLGIWQIEHCHPEVYSSGNIQVAAPHRVPWNYTEILLEGDFAPDRVAKPWGFEMMNDEALRKIWKCRRWWKDETTGELVYCSRFLKDPICKFPSILEAMTKSKTATENLYYRRDGPQEGV